MSSTQNNWEQAAWGVLLLQNCTVPQIRQVIDWFHRFTPAEEIKLVGEEVAQAMPDLGSFEANVSIRLPLYARYILGELKRKHVAIGSDAHLRLQLAHIVTECERSNTQTMRIQRIRRRAEAALEGRLPNFEGVDKHTKNQFARATAAIRQLDQVDNKYSRLVKALTELQQKDPVKHARTMNIGPLYVQFYTQVQEILDKELHQEQGEDL